jgi:hypothetical protein
MPSVVWRIVAELHETGNPAFHGDERGCLGEAVGMGERLAPVALPARE